MWTILNAVSLAAEEPYAKKSSEKPTIFRTKYIFWIETSETSIKSPVLWMSHLGDIQVVWYATEDC